MLVATRVIDAFPFHKADVGLVAQHGAQALSARRLGVLSSRARRSGPVGEFGSASL